MHTHARTRSLARTHDQARTHARTHALSRSPSLPPSLPLSRKAHTPASPPPPTKINKDTHTAAAKRRVRLCHLQTQSNFSPLGNQRYRKPSNGLFEPAHRVSSPCRVPFPCPPCLTTFAECGRAPPLPNAAERMRPRHCGRLGGPAALRRHGVPSTETDLRRHGAPPAVARCRQPAILGAGFSCSSCPYLFMVLRADAAL